MENGQSQILVGMNSIGKTQLAEQILSAEFKKDCPFTLYPVFLDFKNKYPPTTPQLYKYWLTETAKVFSIELDKSIEWNDFTFYSWMFEKIKSLKPTERLAFIILDAHHLLSQKENFFNSLIFLHQYSSGRLSFILLSEPYILDCSNPFARRFIQHFTNFKYHFLKPFDKKTILFDIRGQELIHHTSFNKYTSLISKYSRGLHGVIGAFCLLIKKNPQITNIKELINLAYQNDLCQYWVKDVLDSLPKESLRILREVSTEQYKYGKFKNNIYVRWLMELSLVRSNGKLNYPLMLPLLKKYLPAKEQKNGELQFIKGKFYVDKDKIKLSKKQLLILEILYKKKGKLVTYDEIGELIWQADQDKFSLWAIAQIIRRLRKKLSFYFINPQTIRSIRGEGYILQI